MAGPHLDQVVTWLADPVGPVCFDMADSQQSLVKEVMILATRVLALEEGSVGSNEAVLDELTWLIEDNGKLTSDIADMRVAMHFYHVDAAVDCGETVNTRDAAVDCGENVSYLDTAEESGENGSTLGAAVDCGGNLSTLDAAEECGKDCAEQQIGPRQAGVPAGGGNPGQTSSKMGGLGFCGGGRTEGGGDAAGGDSY